MVFHNLKQQTAPLICGLWLVLLILLPAVSCLHGESTASDNESDRPADNSVSSETEADESSDAWWRRWDAVVEDPNDPEEVVRAKLGAVITVLGSESLEPSLKAKIIDKIVSPVFDFDLMSMLVLGRRHWPALTSDEQRKFTALFTERLKGSYFEKITLYQDEKVRLGPAVPQRMGISISMDIDADDSKIAVHYKLREADNQWRIYDVEVQGVSILMTYRSQFDDILRRGGVEQLFAQLENAATR